MSPHGRVTGVNSIHTGPFYYFFLILSFLDYVLMYEKERRGFGADSSDRVNSSGVSNG